MNNSTATHSNYGRCFLPYLYLN